MWADDVLEFWFRELRPEHWFAKDDALDAKIRERFGALHEAVATEQVEMPLTPRGVLAAIIVLDQFSRNLHRGSSRAFAQDAKALELARRAIEMGLDRELTPMERKFIYMPFMHAEDRTAQAECVRLFTELEDQDSLKYAIEHRDIIDRFGRFPHRNRTLGRRSLPEEEEFLKQHPGF
jgi:uncharacterized protein (DUF924 family)